MLHDILGHDHIQWHPQLIRHYANLWIYYRTWLYYRFWPYYQIPGGSQRSLQRVLLANRRRLLLVLSHLGFAFGLMFRPFSLDLVILSDFEILNSPWYFCFALRKSKCRLNISLAVKHCYFEKWLHEYRILVTIGQFQTVKRNKPGYKIYGRLGARFEANP